MYADYSAWQIVVTIPGSGLLPGKLIRFVFFGM